MEASKLNKYSVWDYQNNQIRILKINNEPWWILTDVCKVLELSNPSRVAERLDDDERSNFELGRQGKGIIINESGLYSVILRSDKPQAKQFKRWVTHEVLPSIRQTGSYSTLQASVSDFDGLSRRIEVLEKEALLRRVDALKTAYQNEDDYGSKCYRSVGQIPAHIIAALNVMLDSGQTIGFMLDFLEDNHIWLSNRGLKEYIRKRKADKCGY